MRELTEAELDFVSAGSGISIVIGQGPKLDIQVGNISIEIGHEHKDHDHDHKPPPHHVVV